MNAFDKNLSLLNRLSRLGKSLTISDADMLRRASMTLSRWSELECGDSDSYKSWAIERDETTNKPYIVIYPHVGKSRRHATPDLETGALKRVAKFCEYQGLFYYHQTDPRGASLYIGNEPLTDQNYSTAGVSCWVDK